jgi:Ca2+-binding RTX toxin-like protein
MVFKVINDETDWEADLFNADDFFGVEDDILTIESPPPYSLIVNTYGGHDQVSVMTGPPPGFVFGTFYLGAGNDTLTGSSAGDTYIDQRGRDLATLGDGLDKVLAGRGNDTIDGGGGSKDSVSFYWLADDMGEDVFNTQGVNFDLADEGVQDLGVFGKDIYRNFESALGGRGDDTLFGSSAANKLAGSQGDDYLRGRGGKDTILGGDDRDTLIGDGAADKLYGGYDEEDDFVDGARDTFRYYSVSDSTNEAMDTIYGFESAALLGRGGDRIDLSRIDADIFAPRSNAFTFIGDEAFSKQPGELRVIEFGGSSFVFVNVDKDTAAEMVIHVAEVVGLTRSDFVL